MTRNISPDHSNISYRNIDDGFGIVKLAINNNPGIVKDPVFTEGIPGPYSLSLTIFEHRVKVGKTLLVLKRACWAFYKPKVRINPFMFSNSSAVSYSFVMGRQWMADNIVFDNEANKLLFFNFLDDKPALLSWLNTAPEALPIAGRIAMLLKKNAPGDTAKLTAESLRLMQLFFNNCFNDSRIADNRSFTGPDYWNIVRAEKVILDHLAEPFIGIKAIAAQAGMSATRLKSHFRDMYGYTLLQYHKENNMQFARQLLGRSDAAIGDIAIATGYDSPGKFASAFKKRFGQLPSGFRKAPI